MNLACANEQLEAQEKGRRRGKEQTQCSTVFPSQHLYIFLKINYNGNRFFLSAMFSVLYVKHDSIGFSLIHTLIWANVCHLGEQLRLLI